MSESEQGRWLSATFAEALEWAVSRHDRREALVCEGQRLTYGELAQRVRAFARGLIEQGVGRGEHVCLWASDCIEWMVARWAVPYIGAVLVPMNTRFRDKDTAFILRQSDSVLLIVESGFESTSYFDILQAIVPEMRHQERGRWRVADLPRLRSVIGFGADVPSSMTSFREVEERGRMLLQRDDALQRRRVEVRPDDVAQLLYTSGTTSLPKGAMVRHGPLLQNNRNTLDRLNLGSQERFLASVPLFTATGTSYTLSTLFCGGTFVIARRYTPERFCRLSQDERITFTFFVDTIVKDLQGFARWKEYDLSSLRTGAGGPLAPDLFRWLVEVFGVSELTNVYGMSETSNAICRSFWHEPLDVRADTNGVPVEGLEVRIADIDSGKALPAGRIGEIRVRGYTVMAGYYNRPEENAAAFDETGWLRTGDLGEMTADGHLAYRGRVKEMIKPAGFNVATQEIEDFVRTFPGVADAVVVGVPHERLGEAAFAYVKPERGATVTAEALVQYCRKHIASYKVPRQVAFIDQFPMTGSGKVKRLELKERARRTVEISGAA